MKSASFVRLLGGSLFCCLLLTGLPASADAFHDAGKLFRAGQYAAAMKQVDVWLAKNPKDAHGRFLKGLIFTEENKTDEAIKVFSALTRDYPELPEPYNNLAVIYAAQGQYEKAKDELEAAIQTHPSYATAHENLGDIYAKLASQAYDKALQLDKSNAKVQTKLELIKTLFSRERLPAESKHVAARQPAKTAQAEPLPVVTEAAKAEIVPAKKAETEPARKTETEHGKESASVDEAKAVVATVEAWAKAWSSQDVAAYLSFYADDFQPPDSKGIAHWKALRKARIERPKFISVTISNPEVALSDEKHATIRFMQSYQSSSMKESVFKVMTLGNYGGKWLIISEKSGH